MTWYAGHVFASPEDKAFQAIAHHPAFRAGLYHVRPSDLENFPWHKDEVRHSLPEKGLLVIREFCPDGGHEAEWHGEDAILWEEFSRPNNIDILYPDAKHNYMDTEPPLGFLQLWKTISLETNSIISFYRSIWWGGEPDAQYGWVFGKEDKLYIEDANHKSWELSSNAEPIQRDSSALKLLLEHHGVSLPTSFFALHERSFPWHKYKVIDPLASSSALIF